MRRISFLVVILVACFASTAWAQAQEDLEQCCNDEQLANPVAITPATGGQGCGEFRALELALQAAAEQCTKLDCDGKCKPDQPPKCLKTALQIPEEKRKHTTVVPKDTGVPCVINGEQRKLWETTVSGFVKCACHCRKVLKPDWGAEPVE